jgi:hypothetical protein
LGKCELDMDFSYFPLSLKSSCNQLTSLKLHCNPKLTGDLSKIIPSSSSSSSSLSSSSALSFDQSLNFGDSKLSQNLGTTINTTTTTTTISNSMGQTVKRGSSLLVLWLHNTSISGDIISFKRTPNLTHCFLDSNQQPVAKNENNNNNNTQENKEDDESKKKFKSVSIYGDIQVFKHCLNLVKLSLKSCSHVWGDISFATDLLMLEELELFDTGIYGDVSALNKLNRMKRLSLGSSKHRSVELKKETFYKDFHLQVKQYYDSKRQMTGSLQMFNETKEVKEEEEEKVEKGTKKLDISTSTSAAAVPPPVCLFGNISFLSEMNSDSLFELRLSGTMIEGDILNTLTKLKHSNKSGLCQLSWLNVANSPYILCHEDKKDELRELLPDASCVFGV